MSRSRGGRGKSTIMSSSEARAQAKRLAAKNAPLPPYVSYDALLGIIDRECDKQGRRWYGVASADRVIEEIRASDPETRKLARQMMLARIEDFPKLDQPFVNHRGVLVTPEVKP